MWVAQSSPLPGPIGTKASDDDCVDDSECLSGVCNANGNPQYCCEDNL